MDAGEEWEERPCKHVRTFNRALYWMSTLKGPFQNNAAFLSQKGPFHLSLHIARFVNFTGLFLLQVNRAI